jgi:hypothetical protein
VTFLGARRARPDGSVSPMALRDGKPSPSAMAYPLPSAMALGDRMGTPRWWEPQGSRAYLPYRPSMGVP